MCEITDKKSCIRTGYKMLAYRDGKFYSTFTGQEISVGQVPKAPERGNRLCTCWTFELDDRPLKEIIAYNPQFDGKTAAFIRKADCQNQIRSTQYWSEMLSDHELVMVKIVFGNTTYKGQYGSESIIASDVIKSIEIVQ